MHAATESEKKFRVEITQNYAVEIRVERYAREMNAYLVLTEFSRLKCDERQRETFHRRWRRKTTARITTTSKIKHEDSKSVTYSIPQRDEIRLPRWVPLRDRHRTSHPKIHESAWVIFCDSQGNLRDVISLFSSRSYLDERNVRSSSLSQNRKLKALRFALIRFAGIRAQLYISLRFNLRIKAD